MATRKLKQVEERVLVVKHRDGRVRVGTKLRGSPMVWQDVTTEGVQVNIPAALVSVSKNERSP